MRRPRWFKRWLYEYLYGAEQLFFVRWICKLYLRFRVLPLTTLLLSLLLPFSARADWPEPWTKTDTAYQLAFTGVTALDLWQTVYIGSPGQCPDIRHETNPLLGDCPTPGRIALAGTGALLGHAAMAYMLPQPYRRWWQMTFIAVEVGVVSHNFYVGVQLTF